MVRAGDGYRFHITGLTHDERGYPSTSLEVHDRGVNRLIDKVRNNARQIIMLEETDTADADVVVVSYGITSRVAVKAIQAARKHGVKVGHLRLITVWPFPEKRLHTLASHVKAFVMPELNMGQMYLELQRCIEGRAATYLVPHSGGTVHDPDVIYQKIMYAAKHPRKKKETPK
jgi:2-oxoglutarate ferredoxin oxidoreductase subunit alpha